MRIEMQRLGFRIESPIFLKALTAEDKATVDQLKEDYDNLTPLQKMLVEEE